jgi:hypothetical protein
MTIEYSGLPSILPDNDLSYFSLLKGAIEGIDPGSSMSVTKGSSGYVFRLVPSTTVSIDMLIQQLTELNTLMGIHLEFSKSVKSTSSIVWMLNF